MKSKQKAKRIYIWCHESRKCIESHFGTRKRNKITGMRRGSKSISLPNKIRCPDCGKQFKPRIKECDDTNCWHIYISAHKKWIKKTKAK